MSEDKQGRVVVRNTTSVRPTRCVTSNQCSANAPVGSRRSVCVHTTHHNRRPDDYQETGIRCAIHWVHVAWEPP